MEAPRLEPKLAATLGAHVEHCRRHMDGDETATRLLRDDWIASYNGRLTGTARGPVVAEFVRVVEPLNCALQIQERLPNAPVARFRQLSLAPNPATKSWGIGHFVARVPS